jgi:hypothetical protein
MITDNATIFAALEALPNGGAAGASNVPITVIAGNTIGGAATTPYYIDLLQTGNPIGYNIDSIGSADLEINVSVTTGFTSTTNPLATVEFQLISFPILPTAAALGSATTSGKLVTAAGVVTSDTNDTFTIANHGLPLATPIYLTAIATTTNITTNTLYFVVPTGANTFKIATTLANALAATPVTVDLQTGAGTATVAFMPVVHATTGAINTVFLKAGSRLLGTAMKQQGAHGGKLVAPYAGAVPLPVALSVAPSYLAPGTLAGIGGGAGTGLIRSPGRYLCLAVTMAGANSDTTGRYSVQVGKNLSNSYTYGPTGLEVR